MFPVVLVSAHKRESLRGIFWLTVPWNHPLDKTPRYTVTKFHPLRVIGLIAGRSRLRLLQPILLEGLLCARARDEVSSTRSSK